LYGGPLLDFCPVNRPPVLSQEGATFRGGGTAIIVIAVVITVAAATATATATAAAAAAVTTHSWDKPGGNVFGRWCGGGAAARTGSLVLEGKSPLGHHRFQ